VGISRVILKSCLKRGVGWMRGNIVSATEFYERNRLPGGIVNAGSEHVLRVDWISTTGASEDLNKLLNYVIPRY